jgi:hypothetical protein
MSSQSDGDLAGDRGRAEDTVEAVDAPSNLTIADRVAIEELAARYNQAFDLGDPRSWVGCFTKNGLFATEAGGEWSSGRGITSAKWQGEEQLLAFAMAATQGSTVRHWSSNRVLTKDGDRVRSVSYMSIFVLEGPHEGDLMTGVMHDELVRGDEGWRYVSRHIVFDR